MDKGPFLEQYKVFILKAKQDISLLHKVLGNNTEFSPYAVEGRYVIIHDGLHDIADMLSKAELF